MRNLSTWSAAASLFFSVSLFSSANEAVQSSPMLAAAGNPEAVQRSLTDFVSSMGNVLAEVPSPVAASAIIVPQAAPASAAPMNKSTPKENEDFQWLLVNMALEPVDQAYCDGKVGGENQSNQAEYRSCRVTRNFLEYIRARPGKVAGRFPPLADIRYCRTQAEGTELTSRLEESMTTPAAPASPGSSANVDAKDKDGNTALMLAAKNGDLKQIKALIAAGADVNAKDKDSYTPLMWAAYKADVESVKDLLAAGAKVEAKTNDGTTALMSAGLSGHPANIKALLAAGADVNATCTDGRTPIMWAASKGDVTSVEALLAAGAKVKAKTDVGDTALMAAARSGDPASIKALIAAGADVNAKRNNGSTALLAAAVNGHAEGVKALLAAGANVNATADGVTALELAANGGGDAEGVKAVIAALKAAGETR